MRGFLDSYLTHPTSNNYQYLITCDELLDFDEDPLDTLVFERYNQLAKAKEQEMI
jgi:hypothetical protein